MLQKSQLILLLIFLNNSEFKYSHIKNNVGTKIKIVNKSTLHRGGFAGLKETRMVVDNKIGGNDSTWNGLGNFVYLSDANFLPHGETSMHPHHEVDVVSIMLEGCIDHKGSLENGKSIQANQAQVQRAGGEGFEHNEVNPDPTPNHMLQLWVLPEIAGEAASYKFYNLELNDLILIYGGQNSDANTFKSQTVIEVGLFDTDYGVKKAGQFLAYVTNGEGKLNGEFVKDGDLVQGEELDFLAASDGMQLTVISVAESN